MENKIAMKKTFLKTSLLFLFVLGFCTISACSKDNDQDKPSQKELLVDNSPWNYKSFELIEVIEDNGSTVSEEEIEEWIDSFANGLSLTFRADGSGQSDSSTNNEETAIWDWQLKNNNEVVLYHPDQKQEVLKIVTLSSTKFTFESETWRPDKDGNKVVFYGRYYFE